MKRRQPPRSDEQSNIDYSKDIAKRICPECHAGLLYPHPQASESAFARRVKCAVCGFTR